MRPWVEVGETRSSDEKVETALAQNARGDSVESTEGDAMSATKELGEIKTPDGQSWDNDTSNWNIWSPRCCRGAEREENLLDNHLYSILSILPDSIFHIPSLTPLFSSCSITFSFLIVVRLRHTINANAISVETPYDARSSPKMFQNRTHCNGPNPLFH